MALDKQINIYSVDTGNFYSSKERELHNRNAQIRRERLNIKNKLKEINSKLKELNDDTVTADPSEIANLSSEYVKWYEIYQHKTLAANQSKQKLLTLLKNKVAQNEISENGKRSSYLHHKRILNPSTLSDSNIISVFDSSLTRTLQIEKDQFTDALMVVQVYYFDVFKDISYYGFWYKGAKYRYFTSSAGQIRKKKAVFIKESIWNQYEKTIMCGLTIEKINSKGGNNVNKHLAYMALTNSATDEWTDFDIDKSIVIDDFETNVFGTYDLIDDIDYSIKRISDYVPITHSDGAGMVLTGPNRMFRAPWIKGLLGKFDYVSLIQEKDWSPVITDIYGQQHDVIKEDIQVIFTKSQFKMWKYYDSWEQYKEYFKKYNCRAGICNVEEEKIKNATINYQMLQTLTDVTDEELMTIASSSIEKLNNICGSLESIKSIFGITPYNTNPTALQKAIKIYPNLLNDEYLKIVIRGIKDSLIKQYKAGKLEIEGKYTFLLPDYYAACEFWFGHIENPGGLLNDGEVFCWLYKHKERLDCLRSPHLFKEHAIRKNVANIEWKNSQNLIHRWFDTNAVYTSCKDLISKILQFDVDGDKSLVVGSEKFIDIVERNMRGIVPLYYNMRKASPQELNSKNIYNGLNAAFTGGNIGLYSNDISKIWNSDVFITGTEEEKNRAIDVVRLLCMENNFVIDFAKTLYKPERPKDKHEVITSFTKEKVPTYFLYAKDKNSDQVSSYLPTTVNRLSRIIPNPRLNFKKLNLGKIDYRLLMHNPYVELDPYVIERYNIENKTYHFKINMKDEDLDNLRYISCYIRNQLSATGHTNTDICDMLVKYLYGKESKNKEVLWFCYGNIIVDNLIRNIKPKNSKLVQCADCGEWIEIDIKDNATCRCPKCAYEHQKELARLRKRRQRQNVTVSN